MEFSLSGVVNDSFAQVLGVIAFLFYLTATQMKTKQAILRYSGIGGLFICANLLLLGGVVSAATALVAASRNLTMATDWGIKRKQQIIAVSLCTILILTAYIQQENWIHKFVVLGPVLGSFAYLQTSMLKVRGFLFASESTWLANALMFGSIGGIFLGLATTSGHMVAIYRFSKDTIKALLLRLYDEQYHANDLAVQYAVPVA